MRPVIQLERTGCGIASAAALAGVSYRRARTVARSLGIFADDPTLWSQTAPVRKLLESLGVSAQSGEERFRTWSLLPDLALLSIKWHREGGKAFWHWVVFVRASGRAYVLDSKASLRKHVRTDFGRMKPRWYIRIAGHPPRVERDARTRAPRAGEREGAPS